MKNQNWIWLVIFSLLLFSSCNDDIESREIDSNLGLRFIEDLSSGDLKIIYYTTLDYSCSASDFDYIYEQTNSSISFNFKKIILSDDCDDNLNQYLYSETLFDSLTNGTYSFIVLINDQNNVGTLEVSDEKYSLNFTELNNLEPEDTTIYKVPTYTFWGTANYTSPELQDKLIALEDTLSKYGASFYNFTPGNYGYFEIDSDGHALEKPETIGHEYNIVFSYDQSNDSLSAILNKVDLQTSDYPINYVLLHLFDWEGHNAFYYSQSEQ